MPWVLPCSVLAAFGTSPRSCSPWNLEFLPPDVKGMDGEGRGAAGPPPDRRDPPDAQRSAEVLLCRAARAPPLLSSSGFCLQGEREEEKSRLELSLHLLAELRAKCQITSDTAPKGRPSTPGAPLVSGGTCGDTGAAGRGRVGTWPDRGPAASPALAESQPQPQKLSLLRFPWKRGIFFSPKLSCVPALSARVEPRRQSPAGRCFLGGAAGALGRV